VVKKELIWGYDGVRTISRTQLANGEKGK
jgi:hypothetical protein